MTDVPAGDARVEGIVQLWSVGDYPAVAAMFAPAAQALVAAADVAGRDVLDVACGTGSVAMAAADAGARSVVGVDLTPRLLDCARRRVAAAGMDVELLHGDFHDLPFDDASFDVTLSSFGAFTSDDPPRCAAELARVTRPGGTVGLTAWTEDSLFGDKPEVAAVLPADVLEARRAAPRPYRWADPDALAEIVAGSGLRIDHLDVGELTFAFPSLPAAYDWFLEVSGPFQMIRAAAVGAGGSARELREAFLAAWERFATDRDDGGIDLTATYRRVLLTGT